MAFKILGRNTELASDLANFVFVKRSQRLNDAVLINERLNPGHGCDVS